MKKVITFFVLTFALSTRLWSLDTYGTYQFTSLSLAATLDPSFVAYGSFSNFAYTPPLLPSGVSGVAMAFYYWNDAALNENKYLSFTVTLNAPNNFNGISLKLNLQNRRVTSDGPPNGEVRYRFGSTGNFLSFTGNTWTPPISTTTLTDYEFDLPINNSNQNVLEIRIYGWNGTAGTGQGRYWVFDNVKLSGSSLPLPIELTSFTVGFTSNHVILNWQTVAETDNSGFDVERASSNNIWQKIGFVSGSGNSNSPKNYSFTDKTATAGKYTYRLKQIDANGGFIYSKEVEVNLGIPKVFALEQNYPNPFNPSTVISYKLPMQSAVQVNVFNSIGEKVAELVNEVKEAGYYELEFNAASLSSGIYYYSIKAGDFVYVKKMMMVK